jgi:hypothetical protein
MPSTAAPFTGCAREGAVEIDEVQPLAARVLERPRLGRGIGVEDGRLVHLAAQEAHGLAVLEVDGGVEDHGRTCRGAFGGSDSVPQGGGGGKMRPAFAHVRVYRARMSRQPCVVQREETHMKHLLYWPSALAGAGGSAAWAGPAVGDWRTAPDDNGHTGMIEVDGLRHALCGTLVQAFDSAGNSVMQSPNIGRQIIWDTRPTGGGSYPRPSLRAGPGPRPTTRA